MNKQKPVPPHNRQKLKVHSIFRSLQGEGPYSGQPAIFIRLAGCNLQCPQCDTDYSNGEDMTIEQIVDDICDHEPTDLIVLTGGEPFNQPIGGLVAVLSGIKTVQLETNGIYFQNMPFKAVCVVCSPKTTTLNENLIPQIDYYKYVLDASSVCEHDGLPLTCFGGYPDRPCRPPIGFDRHKIYVSPLDSKNIDDNLANVKAALDSCMTFGYTLSLQIHKIVGVE